MIILMIDQIVDLHHLVSAVSQILQNLREIFQDVLRVVVKQNDGAVSHITADSLYDLRRADIFPVEAVSVRRSGK